MTYALYTHMEALKSYKEQLESGLNELNKFEGLESDLIQKHGNLRSQFAEYREAIETSNLNEQEKKEHFGIHDELIKRLHKIVLEAKALTRKRTEQMTRDELFKISQERQKALKPQSAEDKIGEEVTKSLKRMLETMRSEVERSSVNISTARSTTKNLEGTTENYQKLSGTLAESRGLIRDLWRRNRSDMIYIFGALGVFVSTVIWVILQRTPGFVWIPAKAVVKQVSNMIPKTGKFVEKFAEVAESILSDEEEPAPEMFVDGIEKEESGEYGSDELLKESNIENIEESTEAVEKTEVKENEPENRNLETHVTKEEHEEQVKQDSIDKEHVQEQTFKHIESVDEPVEVKQEHVDDDVEGGANKNNIDENHGNPDLQEQKNVNEQPIIIEKRDPEIQVPITHALINEPAKEIRAVHDKESEITPYDQNEIPEITNFVKESEKLKVSNPIEPIEINSADHVNANIEKDSDSHVRNTETSHEIFITSETVASLTTEPTPAVEDPQETNTLTETTSTPTTDEIPYDVTPTDSEGIFYSSDAELYSSTEEHLDL